MKDKIIKEEKKGKDKKISVTFTGSSEVDFTTALKQIVKQHLSNQEAT